MPWRGVLRTLSIPGLFFLIVGLYMVFEALFANLGVLLVQPILSVRDMEDLQALLFRPSDEELADPAVRFSIQLLNIFAAGGKLLAGLFFLSLVGEHPITRLGIKQRPPWLLLIMAVAAVLLSGPFIDGLHAFNQNLPLTGEWADQLREWETAAARLTGALVEPGSFLAMATTFLMIVVLAPAWEELVFRGIIQRILEAWTRNGHIAVWIAAALFSAIHLQFLSFIPRMALAVILGYAYLYSRNLWVPILAHVANNGSYVLYSWFTGKAPAPSDPVLTWVLLSLAVVILLLVGLHRFRNSETPPPWVGLPIPIAPSGEDAPHDHPGE